MAAPPSLYRKYRPKGFADLVGQEHVTRSVRNAIKAGLVSMLICFVDLVVAARRVWQRLLPRR